MTPAEIAANSGIIQRLLTMFGATRDAALAWDRDRQNPGSARAQARAGIAGAASEERAPGPNDEVFPGVTRAQMEEMLRNPSPEPATLGLPRNEAPDDLGVTLRNPRAGGPPPMLGPEPPPRDFSDLAADSARFGDVVNPPVTDALMPQSAYQRQEQERSNREAAAIVDAATTVAPFAAAGPVAGAVRTVARAARAFPLPTAAGLAALGGVPSATRSDPPATQPPEPRDIVDARGRLDRIRTEQERLQAELDELRGAAGRFNPERLNPTSNRADIERAQQILKGLNLYRGRIDGRWEGQTAAAVETYLGQLRERQRAIETQLGELGARSEREGAALDGLLRDWRGSRIDSEVHPVDRFIRDNPNVIGAIAGGVVGPAWRIGTTAGSRAQHARTVAEANRLLSRGAADTEARAADMNLFYTRGGGRAPFDVDRTAPLGFRAAADQPTSAAGLYPPGGHPVWRTGDTVRMGSFSGLAGLGEWRALMVREELAEARRAAQAEPSEANLRRVNRAERELALLLIGARTAEGAFSTYPVTSYFARYGSRRNPDTNLAEAEVMRLNRLLGREAPSGPLQPGVTRFRDPRTGEERRLMNDGTWRGLGPTGRDVWRPAPPATWDRISSSDDGSGSGNIG